MAQVPTGRGAGFAGCRPCPLCVLSPRCSGTPLLGGRFSGCPSCRCVAGVQPGTVPPRVYGSQQELFGARSRPPSTRCCPEGGLAPARCRLNPRGPPGGDGARAQPRRGGGRPGAEPPPRFLRGPQRGRGRREAPRVWGGAHGAPLRTPRSHPARDRFKNNFSLFTLILFIYFCAPAAGAGRAPTGRGCGGCAGAAEPRGPPRASAGAPRVPLPEGGPRTPGHPPAPPGLPEPLPERSPGRRGGPQGAGARRGLGGRGGAAARGSAWHGHPPFHPPPFHPALLPLFNFFFFYLE